MKKLLLLTSVFVLLIVTACSTAATPPAPAETPAAAASPVAAQAAKATAAELPSPTAEPATATATPLPPTPAGPFPPVVVSTVPELGAEQSPDAPITLKFDQPMDRASVEKAFAIEPGASVDGAFTWVDDQTVQFAFKNGFQRGQRYRVRVVETAQGQAGLSMQRPFELRFSAAGLLQVTSVQPANTATEIAVDSKVVVMFSRPMVPLGALEQADSLPNPLTFVPPVKGQGEWLNTATYQFTPQIGFEPAISYTGRIAKGLTDVTGNALLTDDFEWTFTTVSPAVVASAPAAGDVYVSPTPVISVAFNQLMDHASVEKSLQLVDEAGGQPVSGQFTWQTGGILPPLNPDAANSGDPTPPAAKPVGVETVAFTPQKPLAPGGNYQLLLPQGVTSKLGAATLADYTASFTVSPLPELVSSNPADGEQFADVWQGVELTFNAPLNPASVRLGDTLLIEPKVAATDVYTSWSNSDTTLNIGFPRSENSSYTVTLTTDVTGRYGQPLARPVTLRWQTLRQTPYVYIVSPKVGIYNGYRPETYIYMTVRNVSRVNFELYRLTPAEFQQLASQSYGGFMSGSDWSNFTPDAAGKVAFWSQPVDPARFENYVYKVDVSQAAFKGKPLPPGLYYLNAFAGPEDMFEAARSADQTEATDRQLLIVSKRNLTIKQGQGDVLAWLTDLQTGQPVTGAPLSWASPDGRNLTGKTAVDGTATFSYTVTPDNNSIRPAMFAGDPANPGDDFAVGSVDWGAGISPYDFSYLYDNGNFTYNRNYAGYVYTERPLYRPGQTVYFKGITRRDDDTRYTIPAGQQVQVVINDAQYRPVYSQTLPLNTWGTFNGSFALDEKASLGGYSLEATLTDPVWGPISVGSHIFTVAEYRKPEFLVTAATNRPEYRAGDVITLTAAAEFFAGGPVANAAVRWTLLSDNYYFDYQGDGYYSFTNEDNYRSNNFNPNYGYGFGQQISSGTGVTDAAGVFTVTVPADLTGRLASQTFTFDVAITGLNNQEVAAQARAVVHKGNIYVGLRPLSTVGKIGQPNQVEVLAVDWQSKPVANQPVELVVARQDWYSVQQFDPAASSGSPDDQYYWTNLVSDVAVFTTSVTTGPDGKATASFTPADGGSYKIVVRALDDRESAVFASTFVWASGYQYINWGQEDNDRIELVADKPEYNTGDTARVLVPHPYSGTVTALVTLERGHIYSHFVTQLKTNSDQLEIPITGPMSPNIYVSVLVVDGMNGSAGIPSFKMGYTRLTINPAEKRLNISLTPGKPAAGSDYRPGEKIKYQVKVTDAQGRPVQAELSLALIDKAVLTLMPETPGQLADAFWQRRALEVNTGVGLTLALDRINRALDERKGGGGGGDNGGPDSVRQNFADTTLWLPNFTTDAAGSGSFEADLPDNLTTWVLLAKAVTGDDTLVGEQRAEIVTAKPLLVRPVTPRFMVVGDELRLGLVAQNNTAEPLTVTPAFTATGLQIGQWRIANGDWLPYDKSATAEIAPGKEVKIEYNVTVAAADEAQLTLGAKDVAGQYGDAVAFSLPVYRLNTLETVATLGVLSEDGVRTEGLMLPAAGNFDPTAGGFTLNIEPSLAGGLLSGLTYLKHYQYECTEQTISRFLPNIVTARAAQKLGLKQPQLAAGLERQVPIGLQKLYALQNTDGGWGWWQGEPSDPTLSAYALLGLVEAQRADFPVDETVLTNAINYLTGTFVASKDIAEPWQANQQAFGLYVLAEAGQPDQSRMNTLFDRREQMDYYGRAFLALGLYLANPEAKSIATLVNDLTTGAITSATGVHWEEPAVDYRAMNSDVRSTAIIVAALSRIQPDHPLLPQAVRWLMTVRQQGGYWSTTQETAWSIIGLTDWLSVSGELAADYHWQASLNGRKLSDGAVNSSNLAEPTPVQLSIADLLAGAVNRLSIERDSAGGKAGGQLYYAAYLNYAKSAQTVQALDRGLTVQRQYSLLNGNGQAITSAKVGDLIRVKLTIIAPTDLHYVMVEDYLPAGAEALDSSLATTSLAAQQPNLTEADSQPFGGGYFTHTDLRDEKAVLFATYLPKGVYEYTYTIRAALPGNYRIVPTHAGQMYFPEVFGRSDSGALKIEQ